MTILDKNPIEQIRKWLNVLEDDLESRDPTEPDGPVTIEALNGIHGGDRPSRSTRLCFGEIRALGNETNSLYLGADGESGTHSSKAGVRIELDGPVNGLEATLSDQTDADRAYLTDDSGDEIATEDVDDDKVVFDKQLGASQYCLLVNSGGEEFQRGQRSVSYPIRPGDELEDGDEGDEEDDELDLGEDGETQSEEWLDDNDSGVRVRVLEDGIKRISAEMSEGTRPYEPDAELTAYLKTRTDPDDDEGEILATADVETHWVCLEPDEPLEEGDVVEIVVNANGERFDRGRRDVSDEFPIAIEALEVDAGIFGSDGADSETYRYAFRRLAPGVDRGGEGEAIEPATEPVQRHEAVELPEDGEEQTGNHTNGCGVAIVPKEDLKGLEVRLGGNPHTGAKDIAELHIYDDEQTRLDSQEITGADGGEWIGIDTELYAGEEYRVLLNASGDRYNRWRSEADYPYGGEDAGLTVINGSYSPGDDSQTESYCYNMDRIRGSRTSGVNENQPDHRDVDLSELASASMAAIDDNPLGGPRDVLRVDYEGGEFNGINKRIYLKHAIGHTPDVAHARYQMFVPDDFEFRNSGRNGGTKIAGFATPNNCGAGGSLCKGQGMSARGMMPRPDGHHGQKCEGDISIGLQVYEAISAEAGEEYGAHHMFEKGGDKGEWITIDIRCEVGEPGEPDSRIVGWVDGEKVFDSDNHGGYLFFDEDHADMGIDLWRFHYYFGGSWRSPKDQSLYLRRFALWGDDNCPELEGVDASE